ncbi:MAG: type II/IV secretion system ATPase subunit [Candidatus Bathyarchaeota archaeon]
MVKLVKSPWLKFTKTKQVKTKKEDNIDPKKAIAEEIETKIKNLTNKNPTLHGVNLVEWYWLDKPFAAAAITKEKTDYTYNIITPSLTTTEYEVMNRVYPRLVDRLSLIEQDPYTVFDKEVSQIINAYMKFNKIQEAKITYFLKRKCFGYDAIDPLFKDTFIEDITCNGPNLPVYVYHVNYGFIPTNITYTEPNLDDFVSHLAELANRYLCLGGPVVEATLKDGSRLTAFWKSEVSDRGSSYSIRKIRTNPLSPIDLIRLGTFNAEIMALLWFLVEHGINMLIIGGTASGKTTTLNALSLFIPKNRRIVSIEDTRELRLLHDNWVPLVVRQEKKVDGIAAAIDEMFLLKRALRLRPEYLLVGEVRGEEARILFQAMNTGHIVFSTIHAGSVEEAFIRLFNPPISVPPAMVTPLDLVLVQSLVQIGNKEIRRCIFIAEIKQIEIETRKVTLLPLYMWDVKSDQFLKVNSLTRVAEKLKRTTVKTEEQIYQEIDQRKRFLEETIIRGIQGYIDFIKAIETYRQTTVNNTLQQEKIR